MVQNAVEGAQTQQASRQSDGWETVGWAAVFDILRRFEALRAHEIKLSAWSVRVGRYDAFSIRGYSNDTARRLTNGYSENNLIGVAVVYMYVYVYI